MRDPGAGAVALLAALVTGSWLGCPTAEAPADDDNTEGLSTSAVVERLAGQWIAEEPVDDHPWDWMDAVYMLGIVRAHELTGESPYLDYVTSWVDLYYPEIESGERFPDASDRVAPHIAAVELMRLLGDERYPAVLANVDEYLATAPRSHDGAILHWGTHFPEQRELLIDSLFMFGGYLVAAYRLTGDRAYLDRFVEQLALFTAACRHDDEGLFVHAWDDELGVNVPDGPIYWARGNGWIVTVTGWYLAWAPEDHEGRAVVEDVFVREVDAWVRYQDQSGLFHTVLNHPEDPDNYLETSATALFLQGAALGIRVGSLDAGTYRPAVVAAHDGVLSRLVEEEDGHLTLEGTSFGTMPTSYENYIGIPVFDDLPLGVGTTLMGLAAADGI